MNTDPGPLAAKKAHLQYWPDYGPAIKRIPVDDGFRYVGPRGRPITDAGTLKRIRKLAIPPAWSDVLICPQPRGHLQATGRDAKGRKQYRYHERWRSIRDASKFDRLLAFAPRCRASVGGSSKTSSCRACRAPKYWPRSFVSWKQR